MRTFILFLLCWGTVIFSYSQTRETIVLTNVGLDSLKKVVEARTNYLFSFEKSETPLLVSVVLDSDNFVDHLRNALVGTGYSLSQWDRFLYILKGAELSTHLPEGFFTPSSKEIHEVSDYEVSLAKRNQEATSASKIYTIGNPNTLFLGNRATVSGYIKNQTNGEPVSNVFISDAASGVNVMTDIYGFYRISLPLGKSDIVVRQYGFEEITLKLELFADGVLDIVMKEVVYSLKGAVVSAEAIQRRRSTFVGIEKLQIDRIKHIPSAFGESDVLKVMLTLPGVKTVGESSGGFNVRGGATDQNLILFNGGTLFNPTHLFGLFSSFNPDIVSDIELFKSTIPAKYGGRISSVLEVNSRQGNSNKITGSAGIGLLTGKFHLEGPLIKEKTIFITGIRTTYSNWILGMIPKSSGYRNGTANFNDITAGISHKIDANNTCYLYGYYSTDQFGFSQDTSYKYSNQNLVFKWRSNFSSKHIMNLSLGYDGYKHNITEKANPINAYEMSFFLKQFFLKAAFDFLINEKHNLSYGVNGIGFDLSPGILSPHGDDSLVAPDGVDKEKGLELALYVSDKWDISHRFTVDMGIRYSLFSSFNPSTYYHGPEFRLSARFLANDKWTLKGGFNTMRQNIHLLSNTVSTTPIDIWKLSSAHISPQTGWQAAMGIYRNFFNNQCEASIESYYKWLNHYLDYKSGAVLNMNKQIEEDVLETRGKAYGLELMLKKPSGKLNGWIAYTYSKTLLREAGKKDIYEINNGQWYPASYDKPHDVKIVANYKFTQRFSLSANVDYASGRPVTVPIGVYYYSQKYWFAYSNRNQYRVPDYFRFDLACNIEPSHNLTLWTHSVITFGVYNVTGRKNAFSVYYATTQSNKVQGYKLSIFGTQIPYINYTIKF